VTRARELRELGDEALEQRLAEAREELFNLRFQHATGQLDNTTRLGELKREIARLHTLAREREIEAAEDMANQETR
jgi:large subunit ribosomal protein L29